MTEIWPDEDSPRERLLDIFFRGVRGKLSGAAQGKGYARTGGDGTPLYDFVSTHLAAGGDSHALGEIVYKTVEASNRPDIRPNLMLKIAAWAFLVWEAGERGKQ